MIINYSKIVRNKNNLAYAVLCLLVAIVVSCKNDPKPDKVVVQEEVVDTTNIVDTEVVEEKIEVKEKKEPKKRTSPKKEKTKEVIKTPPGAPKFKSVAARKYVRDYEIYLAKYKKAVKAKGNMDAFLKLGEDSNSLTKQYRSLLTSLSSDESAKMSKYMSEKVKQIDLLNQQM